LQGSAWLTNELAALDRQNLVLDLQQLLAPSKHGVQINPLTPEQNQFAPEGSRAWLWSRGELSSAPQKDVAPPRPRRRLRTLAKAKALRFLYRLKGR
jgi:hypothetical protein